MISIFLEKKIVLHLASERLRKYFKVIRTALAHSVDGLVIPFLCPDILEHMGYGNPIDHFMPKKHIKTK